MKVTSPFNQVEENTEIEERFNAMANSSPVLLWMAGPDSLCTFFNQTWLDFTGKTFEEEWGVGWASGIHVEDFQVTMDTYMTAFNARSPFEMKYRLRRNDGQYRWILDRGTPIYTQNTFTGYIGSCVDITEIETNRKLLAQSEQRTKKIIQAAPTGMVMVDQKGIIRLVNLEIERLFGYSNTEMIGRPIEILLPQRFAKNHPSNRNSFMHNPSPRLMGVGRDLYGQKKNGEEFPVEVGLNPIDMDDGLYVLASVIDITERKKLEKTKDEFVTVITHELRTPLSAIREALNIVIDGLDGPVNPDQNETLTVAQQNVERLSRLVTNVLDFQRLESGALTIMRTPIRLDQIVIESSKLLAMEAKARQIDVQLNIPNYSVEIEGDADCIEQVLFNLGQNAIKFSNAGATVTIALETDATKCTLTVSDSGPGIPTEDQEKIFEMFGQSHQHGYWKTGGAGVGLAVCKKIVEFHQGNISVQSRLGQGSIFTIVLPKQQIATQ